MPTAITIFGVAKGAAPSELCYAYMRLVRGPGAYPAPTLPSAAQKNGTRRIPIEEFEGLNLLTWDTILEDSASETLQAELNSGRFSIPQECPIEPGKLIPGQPFVPVIIMESHDMVRATGTGALYVKGMAIDQGVDRVTRGLNEAIGPVKSQAVLARLIELISEQSGLGPFFKENRRIGAIGKIRRDPGGRERGHPRD